MSAAPAQHAPTAVIDSAPAPVTLIRPAKGWVSLRLGELWSYRELLYFLVWRDVKVRYKQTALGAAWAVLQPLATMAIFTLVFGRLAKVPSDGVPYPVFAYCALLPWQLFANAVSESGNSVVNNQHLVKKVFFPRLLIPIAPIMTGLVDFTIAFVLLALMMIHYGIHPGAAVVTVPLFLLLAVASALGIGLWLSALNVQYRDVRHVIPFLVQFWLFATPVAYPSSLVPAKWRLLYGLNPMAGVVEGFRWALLGTRNSPGPMLAVSIAAVAALVLGGLIYFRRMETTFADL